MIAGMYSTFTATSLARSWLSLWTDTNPLNVSPRNISLRYEEQNVLIILESIIMS